MRRDPSFISRAALAPVAVHGRGRNPDPGRPADQTGREYPDGTRATFVYDAAGNRTTTENQAVTVTATYDGLNRRDFVTTDYKV